MSYLVGAPVVANALGLQPRSVQNLVRRGRRLPVATDVRTRAGLFDVRDVLALQKLRRGGG